MYMGMMWYVSSKSSTLYICIYIRYAYMCSMSLDLSCFLNILNISRWEMRVLALAKFLFPPVSFFFPSFFHPSVLHAISILLQSVRIMISMLNNRRKDRTNGYHIYYSQNVTGINFFDFYIEHIFLLFLALLHVNQRTEY